MLDHVGCRVKDPAAARRFYYHTMETLGLQVIDNSPTSFLIGRSAAEPIPFIYYAAYVLDPDGNHIEAGFRGN